MFNKKEKELVKTMNNIILKKKELSAYYKNKLIKLSKEINKKNLKEASNKLVKKKNKQKGGNDFKKGDIVIYTRSQKSDKRYVIISVNKTMFGFIKSYNIASIENYINTKNNSIKIGNIVVDDKFIIVVNKEFIEKVEYKKNQSVLYNGAKYKISNVYTELNENTKIELKNSGAKVEDPRVARVKQIQFKLLSDNIMMHSSTFVDEAFIADMDIDDNKKDSNMINSMNTFLLDYTFKLSSGKSGALVYLLGKYEYTDELLVKAYNLLKKNKKSNSEENLVSQYIEKFYSKTLSSLNQIEKKSFLEKKKMN